MSNVDLSRVPEFFHRYVNHAINDDLETALKKHPVTFYSFLEKIPDEKWDYRYAEGKWSIRDIVQHIIDCERVFAYRALRFARHDRTELPPFDENLWAEHSNAANRSKADLLSELKTVQESSVQMLHSFDDDNLEQSGVASGRSNYVRGIAYILFGHPLHHKQVIEERYLS
jgi:uncharacterized damage-inducible protein DinB